MMKTVSNILASSAVALAIMLPISSQVNAMPISKNGYSYSGSGNTFEGAGLEWLRWSETLNMTVNEATTAYESQGYRIATASEGDHLINALVPTTERFALYSGGDASTIFDIVGAPTGVPGLDLTFDLAASASAGYGLDDDNNGDINGFSFTAFYNDDYVNPTPIIFPSGDIVPGYSALERVYNIIRMDYTRFPTAGVMLVRDLPTAVSEPTSIALFSLGLAGLALAKRSKKQK